MSYIIAPFRRDGGSGGVKGSYPEFADAMRALETATKNRAMAIWPGFTPGGLFPQANQFGLGHILPKNTTGVSGLFGSNSYVKRFSSPGSWTNIFSYTVANDLIHSFAGFGFPEPYMIFNGLRFTFADRVYPIVWLEEAREYVDDGKGIAIILKPDQNEELVVPEKTSVLVEGYQERGTSGMTHRVTPLGLAAYRQRDVYITKSSN